MEDVFKIYTDGGARGNPGPAAAAFVVVKGGKVLTKESAYLGVTTNNEAEYKALLMALKWLTENQKDFKDGSVSICLDSELVVRQLTGIYKVKNENLKTLLTKAKDLEREIKIDSQYVVVRREKNKLADKLVNMKLDENLVQFHVNQKK